MVTVTARKWGNSLGIVLPKDEAEKLNIQEGDKVIVEIKKKTNPLKELYGFGKDNPITKEEFHEFRRSLESKYI